MAKSIFITLLILAGLNAQLGCAVGEPDKTIPASSTGVIATELSAGELSGLYLNAGTQVPIVLIVPGSGPTDRDGNNPLGVNANTYKHLAKQLSERGVSSVRVDKRGMFTSASAGDPNMVTVDIYAQDYQSWIDTIREETSAPCIYLLGHSEGAIMVSAAAIGRSDVCGIILVSGVGRPFGDVLRAQLKANPANAPILKQAFTTIDELEAGKRVDVSNLHPALAQLFASEVQEFLISLLGVDPAALARTAAQRTLILQGATDLQTSIVDAELLGNAIGVRPLILDGVNHILKVAPEDRAANLATYSDPDLPVAEPVIDAIAEFVLPQ